MSTTASWDAIRRQLYADADRLRPPNGVPVNLEQILRRLGLELRFEVHRGRLPSHGSLVPIGTRTAIVVRRSESREGLAPRERFTIAHEIGHYCLEARFGLRPRSKGDYWRTERLCNQFAGRLLVSPEQVNEVTQQSPASNIALLQAIQAAAERWDVSVEVATREVVARLPNISICQLREREAEQSYLAELLWCVEGFGFIESGRRTQITAHHPLAAVLAGHRDTRDGEWKQVIVSGVPTASQRIGKRIMVAALLPPDGQSSLADIH